MFYSKNKNEDNHDMKQGFMTLGLANLAWGFLLSRLATNEWGLILFNLRVPMKSAFLTASQCKIQLAQCISKLLRTDGLAAYIQLLASALTLKSSGLNFRSS